jgi:hypothetical protein
LVLLLHIIFQILIIINYRLKLVTEEKFQKSPEIRILVKEKQIIQERIFKLGQKLGDQKLIEKEATEFIRNRVKLYLTISQINEWRTATPNQKGLAVPFNTIDKNYESPSKSQSYKVKQASNINEIKQQVSFKKSMF